MPELPTDNTIHQTRWADGGARITLEITSRGPLAASVYHYIAEVVEDAENTRRFGFRGHAERLRRKTWSARRIGDRNIDEFVVGIDAQNLDGDTCGIRLFEVGRLGKLKEACSGAVQVDLDLSLTRGGSGRRCQTLGLRTSP